MAGRRDVALLFLTRTVRMVAYGTIGVVLAVYLSAVGLSNNQMGLLLTLTLLGDSAISLGVTRWADRIGRRLMLVTSCLLMILAGVVYGTVQRPSFALLLVAATVGVLSPSGNEVGPFMALEQSVLAELVGQANRTHVFAWYNLVGYSMTAVGALAAGHALTWAQQTYDVSELEGYRGVFLQYGISGGVLLLLFLMLTDQVERPELRPMAVADAAPVPHGRLGAGAAGRDGADDADDEESGLRAPLLQDQDQDQGADGSQPRLEIEMEPEEELRDGADVDVVEEGGGGDGGDDEGMQRVMSFPLPMDAMTDEGSDFVGSEHDCGTPPRVAPATTATWASPAAVAGSDIAVSIAAIAAVGAKAPGAPRRAAATKSGVSVIGEGESEGEGEDHADNGRCGAMGLSARSWRIVVQLSVLFATDSFAGGLVTGTLLAYYFQTKYGVSMAYLGNLLFGANMLAAVSSLLSGYVAARIGLINTMVFTHLPSNVLMLLVPLMPTLELATVMVFLRFSISQMDVAPRASYVAGVVRPEERTAAMGIVNIAKSIGAAFGPLLTGWLADKGLFNWAFFLCGGLKIVYDLLLLWSFSHIKPEH